MHKFDAKQDLHGIVASLHTPFTNRNQFDAQSLARLIEHCQHAGCAGILVAAVAGEVGALNSTERRELLKVAMCTAGDRMSVVAGISASSVEESRKLAGEASSLGVPMVMWQPPAGLTGSALLDGLKSIAAAGDVQIMLQDLDWHGTGLSADDIADLAAAVPAMTAVKIETVPAGPKYSAVKARCAVNLHLSGGWAVMQMLDGLARGLDAFIPSGLLPLHVQLFRAWQRGETDEARRLFEAMLPIMAFSNQHIDVSGRFWKQVRVRQGFFATDHCRLPKPLDPVQQAEADHFIERVLAMEATCQNSQP